MARKAVAPALPALVIAIGLLGTAAAPAGAADCPNAGLPTAQVTLDQFNASMFCLINQTRAANGVRTLRPNPLLRRAAVAYTSSLLRGRFFPSRRLRRPSPLLDVRRPRARDRIHPARLRLDRGRGPALVHSGDELARGHHRDVNGERRPSDGLLKPKLDEVGVAGARGTPIDPDLPDGVTVAAEFGFRRVR